MIKDLPCYAGFISTTLRFAPLAPRVKGEITKEKNIIQKIENIILFESTNDFPEVQQSIQIIRQHLPTLQTKTFENYGHFCIEDLKTEAFPELLEACLN